MKNNMIPKGIFITVDKMWLSEDFTGFILDQDQQWSVELLFVVICIRRYTDVHDTANILFYAIQETAGSIIYQ